MRGLGPRCRKNQDQDTGTTRGAWKDWGRNSGAGTQREHRVRAKGYEHGILGQVTGMWEDQDRDIGDRENNRIPGQKGTRIRTRIWVTGIRTGTKGTGYWDLDRHKKGLGTGQRCGGTGTVTWGRTKTETKNIPVLGPEQGHGG